MNIEKFFTDIKYAISWGIIGVLILSVFGSIFLITKTVREIKLTAFENPPYYNSVNIVGEGEILAVPNIAKFNFAINEGSESVDSAQEASTKKVNNAIEYLKQNGIEEKDIKTVAYNINPKYEWQEVPCAFGMRCEPGNSVLVGYEVFQSVDVKIRNTEKAGEILAGIGKIGISNVSGLEFTMDDDSELKRQARELAIEDAKKKMEDISKKLGIKTGKIVSFYEESPMPPVYGYGMGGDMMMESKSVTAIPQLPIGENKIVSKVSVTFEIK